MGKVNIVALGGLDENGKNMYAIEINDQILVVNAGLAYPQGNQFGVEVIVPKTDYLQQRQDRIAGIVLTHAHDDMMNGLPYILKDLRVPVYGPAMCHKVLKHIMSDEEYGKLEYHEMPRNGETEIKGIKVTSFGLTHSTPDAIGIAIWTPDGLIVIAEQFVVDFDMHDKAFDSDISQIAKIGKNNVLAMMIESSYAGLDQYTAPRHRITNLIRPVFEEAKGRIIVSVYNQNYIRIKEIVALAKEYGRFVFFYDDKLKQRLQDMADLGYYQLPRNIEISKQNFSNDIENIVIIVSGAGYRLFTAMNVIATGEDPLVELKESDTVIIASPVVAGTENKASDMENELYKDNITVRKLDSRAVLAAHPSREDIKMLLYLFKPKYFIPTMGEYRNFVEAANMAMASGFTPDRIVILDNGQMAKFKDGKLTSTSDMIPVGDVMVGEMTDKSITSAVLDDRATLATDGVIIIGIAIDFKTKEIIAGPDVQSRGVIYVKDSEYIIKNVGKMTVDLIQERVQDHSYENTAARRELHERISRYVFKETGKKPMIMPMIIEINMPADKPQKKKAESPQPEKEAKKEKKPSRRKTAKPEQ